MNFKKVLCINLIAICFLVTGCSGSSEKIDEAKSSQPEVGESEETRIVNVAGIDYEVPTNPQRVIAYEGYIGSVMALDTPVVGTVFRENYDYSHLGDLSGVEDVGAPISVEKALELEPDLIITYDETNLEQLQQITTVVYIPYGYTRSTQEEMILIGDILNKQDEATTWITEFEAEANQLRERLAEVIPADATVGLYETFGDILYIYGDNFGRGGQAIYNALGLQAPQRIVEDVIEGDQWMEISYEVLPEFEADFMFITQFQSNSEETLANIIESNPVWGTLDAVKNNQVFLNDFNVFIHFDTLAVRSQMHLITDTIIAQVQENTQQ